MQYLKVMPKNNITYFERSFQNKVFQTPIFYGTPKVHKTMKKTRYYSMLLVISTSRSFNKISSKYGEYYLQTLLPNT